MDEVLIEINLAIDRVTKNRGNENEANAMLLIANAILLHAKVTALTGKKEE